jgi:hypothetical protein
MRSRLILGAVSAAVLSIVFAGVVAADTVTGQHGNYVMNDNGDAAATGAICRYADVGNLTYDIYKMVARAPSVWWMNTDSNKTTQHGTVGWRLIVLHKAPAASTWSTVGKTSIQKKTAYEDQLVPYAASTKAPFTNLTFSINKANYPTTEQFMARVKVFWYKSDGTVKGSVVHDVTYYRWAVGPATLGVNPRCDRRVYN